MVGRWGSWPSGDVEEQRASRPEPAHPHQHRAQHPPRQGREVPHGEEPRRRDAEEHRQGIEAHIEASARRGLAEPQPEQPQALPTDPREEEDLDQPGEGVHPGHGRARWDTPRLTRGCACRRCATAPPRNVNQTSPRVATSSAPARGRCRT